MTFEQQEDYREQMKRATYLYMYNSYWSHRRILDNPDKWDATSTAVIEAGIKMAIVEDVALERGLWDSIKGCDSDTPTETILP